MTGEHPAKQKARAAAKAGDDPGRFGAGSTPDGKDAPRTHTQPPHPIPARAPVLSILWWLALEQSFCVLDTE